MSILSSIFGNYSDDLAKAASKVVASNADDAILEKAIGGLVKSQPTKEAYDSAREKALSFLKNSESDDVISRSRQYLKPGQTIYRANTTPLGISWTTSRENALKEVTNPDDIIEYVLQENDRYISPQFVDKFSNSAYPQQEVIFNGRGLVDNSGRIIPTELRDKVSGLPSDMFTAEGNLRSDVLSRLLERSKNG